MSQQELILRHNRVTYLNGDLLSAEDLRRARITIADAVFILADTHTSDTDIQDSATALRAMNVRRFAPRTPVYVQILEPENKHHVIEAGIPTENILCVNEMKLGLMAQAVRCPGLSTLISNLVASSDVAASPQDPAWFELYSHGLSQELYCVDLGEIASGKRFSELALTIFTDFELLVIGIKQRRGAQGRVVLNPGTSYVVESSDMIFVIAEDQAQVERMHRHLQRRLVAADGAEASAATSGSRRRSGLLDTFLRSPSSNIVQSSLNYTVKDGHMTLNPTQNLNETDDHSEQADSPVARPPVIPRAARTFPTRMAFRSGGQRRGSLLMERVRAESFGDILNGEVAPDQLKAASTLPPLKELVARNASQKPLFSDSSQSLVGSQPSRLTDGSSSVAYSRPQSLKIRREAGVNIGQRVGEYSMPWPCAG